MSYLDNVNSFDDPMIKSLDPDTIRLVICGSIKSFSCCENLPQGLHTLYLFGNQISSFEFCENLPQGLKTLYIWDNQISSFKGAEGLPQGLQTFNIGGNPIYNPIVDPLQQIKHYKKFQGCLLEIQQYHFKKEFEYCLNEIKYNPRIEPMRSQLQEEELLKQTNP